eukprot:3196052-Pyramimonas_sp.AAC.1
MFANMPGSSSPSFSNLLRLSHRAQPQHLVQVRGFAPRDRMRKECSRTLFRLETASVLITLVGAWSGMEEEYLCFAPAAAWQRAPVRIALPAA